MSYLFMDCSFTILGHADIMHAIALRFVEIVLHLLSVIFSLHDYDDEDVFVIECCCQCSYIYILSDEPLCGCTGHVCIVFE